MEQKNYKYEDRRKEKIDMYIARSLDLVNWLCQRGFRLLKVEDSEKNPKYKVFLFRETKALHECADEWFLLNNK